MGWTMAMRFLIGCATCMWLGVAHAVPESPPTSEVRPIAKAQVQKAPHGKAEITHLAQGKNAYVGRLHLAAHAKVPEHADATEEYLYILEGSGTVTIDGKVSAVAPGTTIYMAAGARVSYVNGPKPLIAIQIFAGPAPANKYQNWTGSAPLGR